MPIIPPSPTDILTPNVAWTQQDYRIYNDDGNINVASAKAAKNTAASVQLNTAARIRISVQETANESSGAQRYALECRINGGAWFTLDNLTQTFMSIRLSSLVTDAAVTTQLLGATTFVAGEFIENNRNTSAITLTSSGGNPIQTEIEWCVYFPFGGGLNIGDIVNFRVVASTSVWTGGPLSGTILTSYANLATVNITAASGVVTMPERATVYESSALGVEVTPGTAVAATKRLLATELDPDPQTAIRTYRPMGIKAVTQGSVGKEITDINMAGDMAYNDFVYLCSSLLQLVAPTTPANNGIWSVGVGAASAGTFTLTYGGVTTIPIAYNATAAVVLAALQALPTVGVNAVAVALVSAGNWTITFSGPLSTGGALTGAGGGLTGGAFTVTTTAAVRTRRYTFFPGYITPDTIQTFTLEKGVSGAATLAQQIAYVVMRQLSLKINKGEASLTGNAFGRISNDTFTMTAAGSVADVPVVPVNPKEISVWLGDALTPGAGANSGTLSSSTNASPTVVTTAAPHNLQTGDLVSIVGHLVNTAANGFWTVTVISATTFSLNGSVGNGIGAATGNWYQVTSIVPAARLTRCLDAELGIASRFGPIITIDDSVTSFSAPVEMPPDLSAKFTVEHDAAGQAILAKVRAGTVQFVVIEAKSALAIEGAGNTLYPYRAKITVPVIFTQPNRGDVDGVYCSILDGTIAYNTAFGGWIKVEVDTSMTGL